MTGYRSLIRKGSEIGPFPGLRPYDAAESAFYFGREDQVHELLGRLRTTRFVCVAGSSGCGKSSLVRAGVLPPLEKGFMAEGDGRWRIAIMRPGENPIANLAVALSEPEVFGSTGTTNPLFENLVQANLRTGSMGISRAAYAARVADQDKLLILVDQFEEVFRFAERTEHPDAAQDAQDFITLLLRASQQEALRVHVILTMRSDAMGACTQFDGLPEAINRGLYLIPQLSDNQMRDAINRPIERASGSIDPDLVNRLLSDVGEDQDQLPVLQHALMRMWVKQCDRNKPIGIAEYERIGTLENALSVHMAEIFNDVLTPKQRGIAKTLFRSLTRVSPELQFDRRLAKIEDVARTAGCENEELIEVVQQFRKDGRSFLMPPLGEELAADTMIDLSHESLIRQWDWLRKWTQEDHRFGRIQRLIAHDASEWVQAGKKGRHLSGVRLAEGLEMLHARPGDLTTDQKAYVKASEKRQKRARQLMFGVFAVIVASVLGLLYVTATREAQKKVNQVQAEVKKKETAIARREGVLARDRAAFTEELYLASAATLASEAVIRPDPSEDDVAKCLLISRALFGCNCVPGTPLRVVHCLARGLLASSRHLPAALRISLPGADPVSAREVILGAEGDWIAVRAPERTVLWKRADGKYRIACVIRVRTPDSAAPLAAFGAGGTVFAVAATTGGGGGRRRGSAIQLYDLADIAARCPEPSAVTELAPSATTMAVSRDGQWLATGHEDGRVVLRALSGGRVAANGEALPAHKREGAVRGVYFSPDSRWLASAGSDGVAHLTSVGREDPPVTALELADRRASGESPDRITFSADGRWLAAVSGNAAGEPPRLFALARATGGGLSKPHRLPLGAAPRRRFRGIAFSPDSRWLSASVGGQRSAVLSWPLPDAGTPDPDPLVRMAGADGLSQLAYSADGRWLLAAATSGLLGWSMEEGRGPAWSPMKFHSESVQALACPQGGGVVVGDAEGRIYAVADTESLRDGVEPSVVQLPGPEAAGRVVATAAITSDAWAIMGWGDGSVVARQLEPVGEPLVLVAAGGARATHIVTHDQEGALVLATDDGSLRVTDGWSAQGRLPWVSLQERGDVGFLHVVLGEKGRWICAIREDGVGKLWGRQDQNPPWMPMPMPWSREGVKLNRVALSSDAGLLVLADASGDLLSVDLTQEERPLRAIRHSKGRQHGVVSALCFDRYGDQLAVGHEQGVLSVWDWSDERLRHRASVVASRGSEIRNLAFSADGDLLYAADHAGIQIWDISAEGGFTGTPRVVANPSRRRPTVDAAGRQSATSPGPRDATGPDFAAGAGETGKLLATVRHGRVTLISSDKEAAGGLDKTVVSGGGPFAEIGARFVDEGEYLVTIDSQAVCRIWWMRLEEVFRKVEPRVGRNFKLDEWQTFFPGQDYRKTFDGLPVHPTVIAAEVSKLRGAGNEELGELPALLEPDFPGESARKEAKRLRVRSRGLSLAKEGKLEEAEARLREAGSEYPREEARSVRAAALLTRANLRVRTGTVESAVGDLVQAWALDPGIAVSSASMEIEQRVWASLVRKVQSSLESEDVAAAAGLLKRIDSNLQLPATWKTKMAGWKLMIEKARK